MSTPGIAILTVLILSALCAGMHPLHAADTDEARLIAILNSDAPKSEKAISCKRLAVCGGKDAAPALAALLSDTELASWARIGLETIPHPDCGRVLREAAGRLEGILLVGVINSIGVRRDSEATDLLIAKLRDPDNEVACAAAAALGRMGSANASRELVALLQHENRRLRSSAAYACVVCAERHMKEDRRTQAIALYEAVRTSDLPMNRIVEATRGEILARGDAGAAMIPALLQSAEKQLFQVALRTLSEMPRLEMTETLDGAFKQLSPFRQGLTIQAMAHARAPETIAIIMHMAEGASMEARLAVVSSLRTIGNASCLPRLLDYATGTEASLADDARDVMGMLPGEDVDAFIVAELKKEAEGQLAVLLKTAVYRGIKECLPLAEKLATHKDPAISASALEALGMLGETGHIPVLVKLMSAADDDVAARKALISIAARERSRSVSALLPLSADNQSSVRQNALSILAAAGGAEALNAVVAALKDEDPHVTDEAVRVLSIWPSNWPDDSGIEGPLLALAQPGNALKHQVLALRGYVDYLNVNGNLSAGEKIAKAEAILKLAPRPEEARLIQALLKGRQK